MSMQTLQKADFLVLHFLRIICVICQLSLATLALKNHAFNENEAPNLEEILSFEKLKNSKLIYLNSDHLAHGFSDSEIIVPIRLHHVSGDPVSHGRHFRKREILTHDSCLKKERNPLSEFPFIRFQQTQNDSTFNDVTVDDVIFGRHANNLIHDDADDVNHSVANFSLVAFGEHYKFHLTPYSEFFAPSYNVRYLRNTSDENFRNSPKHCFYSGFVNENRNHKVVLSLCGGMFGAFRTSTSDYLIEPESGFSDEEDAKPHRIYRRSTRTAGNHGKLMCGYIDSDDKDAKESTIRNGNTLLQNFENFLKQPTTSPTRKKNNRLKMFHKTKRKHSETQKVQSKSQREANQVSLAHFNHSQNDSPKLKGNDKILNRRKRYVSLPRNIEVMVTADNEMVNSHEDVEHYVLTLMAIVNHIFRDPSIENYINIVVVELVLIGSSQIENGPHVVQNAHACLKNFCDWQFRHNHPDDSHPTHYDTAVLLTGKDLCRSETACDTLGLAELGTMCESRKSCAINEDNGLSTAFTIAHELGHQLNAPHDNSDKCRDSVGHTPQMHVMSPTLDNNAHPWSWSTCSAKYISSFLDNRNGECLLDDPPPRLLSLPTEEPGQLYDASDQCKLIYGEETTHCSFMFRNSCKRLWCTSKNVRNGCRTSHLPWADGTSCGDQMWCQQGECVPRNRRRLPVNGNWGDWGKFGECSRTCGGGVKIAERSCNNPKPQHGGRYCLGRKMKFRSCNYQNCPLEQDFRLEQCAAFNKWSLHHKYRIWGIPNVAHWTPKYDGIMERDQCKLTCQIRSRASVSWYVLRPRVINGTPCVPDSNDICVEGVCKEAGCDRVLGSSASEDKCGVCQGDNSTCRQVNGTYNIGNKIGYNLVTVVPAGAIRIFISQQSHTGNANDNNYLVLRETRGNYILNGNRSVMKSKQKIRKRSSDGSGKSIYHCDYSGTNNRVETISCYSPILVDLSIEVLAAGNLNPPDIKFKYNLPLNKGMIFRWQANEEWGRCSKDCKGIMKRNVSCVDVYDEIVPDRKCSHLPKPVYAARLCNNHCDFRWYANVSKCSSHCGNGTTFRLFQCWKVRNPLHPQNRIETVHLMEVVSETLCSNRKPYSVVPCQGSCLPTNWEYGDWSGCPVSCGGGIQIREVKCKDTEGNEFGHDECRQEHESLSKPCATFSCSQWVTSAFSECSTTCGNGMQNRKVWCENRGVTSSESHCDVEAKPALNISCKKQDCPKWKFQNWSQCSVSCGEGVMTGLYHCLDHHDRRVNDSWCDSASLRPDVRPCSVARSCDDWMRTESESDGFPLVVYRNIARKDSPYQGNKLEPTSPPSGPALSSSKPRNSISGDVGLDISSKTYKDVDVINAHHKVAMWRTGAWTQCSTTCGAGIRLRYVSCRNRNNMKELDERACGPAQEKPPEQEMCRSRSCVGQWRTGEWSMCSPSCGNGTQRRVVKCRDMIGQPASCDLIAKPAEIQACNERTCPKWRRGEWGECSRTCGRGNRTRVVVCVFDDQTVTRDQDCDVTQRPIGVGMCRVRCKKKYHWKKGSWGPCSATCGRGIKSRVVQCVDRKRRNVSDDLCTELRGTKPRAVRHCSTKQRCPKWRAGIWNECTSSCGPGKQTRWVACKYKRKVIVDQLCDVNLRPDDVRKCNVHNCTVYDWHVGPWSQCSRSCGIGIKQRMAECRGVGGENAPNSSFCRSSVNQIDPATQMSCNHGPCGTSAWKVGHWNECSVSCGSGVQTRSVKCVYIHPVNYSEIDKSDCDVAKKPHGIRDCNRGGCNAAVFWRVGAWSECSASCGEGTSIRKVVCTNRKTLATLQDEVCMSYPSFKPDRLRNCRKTLCNPESCYELKQQQSMTKDGEVYLKVRNKIIQIYCHGMNTSNPTEYLTLPFKDENYSEIFGKRLIDPNSCPANGSRLSHCSCLQNRQGAGFTRFQKIRINVKNMKIIANDFTFSETRFGKQVAFGVAGDCYSRSNCPQGTFNINLIGTNLIVSNATRWKSYGTNSSLRVDRHSNSQVINGKCGGYCSRCQADPTIGLVLNLKPE